jgi:putative transposase
MILKLLPNRKVQVEHQGFQTPVIYTQAELIKLLSEGRLEFQVSGKNIRKTADGTIPTTYHINDLDSVKYKEVTIFKFEVIKPLLVIGKRSIAVVRQRVEEINQLAENPNLALKTLGTSFVKKVSFSSVYRWMSDYEKSDGDIRSLIPSYHNSGGPGQSRFHPKVMEFVNQSIDDFYLNEQQVTVEEIFFDVVNRVVDYNQFAPEKIEWPSQSTMARIVSKIPEFELVSKRIGGRTAELGYKPIGDGVKVSFPLERVEIDSTELNIKILFPDGSKKDRPNLVAAIDKFSTNPLGLSLGFGGVGWPEVMQCFHHVLSDKSYVKEKYTFVKNEWNAFGVPASIVVDNGLEFKNNPMKDACYQLGISLEFAPPHTPEWKGSIERFFGTVETNFVHKQPGTTRSNPKQLGDDEDPDKKACIPYNIFLGLLHKWIIDVYSQDLNKGAGGIPSKIWEKATEEYPVDWPNSSHELAILLGRIEYRVITNRGIELNCLTYNSTELNQLLRKFSKHNKGAEQRFKIKYDPQNLGHVNVYDHLITNDWIKKVPCTDQRYAEGLSEWEHEEARKFAAKEYGSVDIVSLARAKAFLREQVAALSSKKRQNKSKDVQSGFEIFGETSKTYNKSDVKVDYRLPETPDTKVSTNSDISDIGTSFDDSDSIDIIPGSLTVINQNGEVKPVSRKGKTRSPKKQKSTSSGTDIDTKGSDELTPSDLVGFHVINNEQPGTFSETDIVVNDSDELTPDDLAGFYVIRKSDNEG